MAASASYIEFIKDLFSPFGDISVRKMFGGAGVYCDGIFFAIIGNDDLWLKVDDVTRAEFESHGLDPFTIEMKNGRTGAMSYYEAPEDIYDDADILKYWADLALSAAYRAKNISKEKASKKKKPKANKKTRSGVKK